VTTSKSSVLLPQLSHLNPTGQFDVSRASSVMVLPHSATGFEPEGTREGNNRDIVHSLRFGRIVLVVV
jgi:hypothetical protein